MPRIAFVTCTTTHGGLVKTGQNAWRLWADVVPGGLPVACVGDIVTCPDHGDNPILPAGNILHNTYVNGRLVALEGYQTQCGSSLIVLPCSFEQSHGFPLEKIDADVSFKVEEF